MIALRAGFGVGFVLVSGIVNIGIGDGLQLVVVPARERELAWGTKVIVGVEIRGRVASLLLFLVGRLGGFRKKIW
jgi:hypothetical protein